MSKEIRARLRRAIVGAIASSDLESADIPAILRLLADDAFARDLADVLRPLLRPAEAGAAPSAPAVSDKAVRKYDLAENLLTAVRHRRLSKERLQRYMAEINPRLHAKPFRANVSMEQMIDEFVGRASIDEAFQLLRRLSGGEEDPYLKGITRQ